MPVLLDMASYSIITVISRYSKTMGTAVKTNFEVFVKKID